MTKLNFGTPSLNKEDKNNSIKSFFRNKLKQI